MSEKIDVILYVHVSIESPVYDSDSMDGDDKADERIVLHKYRCVAGLTPEELALIDFVQRSSWKDVRKNATAMAFLNSGWKELRRPFFEMGSYEVPEDIRIVQVLHVTSYDLAD